MPDFGQAFPWLDGYFYRLTVFCIEILYFLIIFFTFFYESWVIVGPTFPNLPDIFLLGADFSSYWHFFLDPVTILPPSSADNLKSRQTRVSYVAASKTYNVNIHETLHEKWPEKVGADPRK